MQPGSFVSDSEKILRRIQRLYIPYCSFRIKTESLSILHVKMLLSLNDDTIRITTQLPQLLSDNKLFLLSMILVLKMH